MSLPYKTYQPLLIGELSQMWFPQLRIKDTVDHAGLLLQLLLLKATLLLTQENSRFFLPNRWSNVLLILKNVEAKEDATEPLLKSQWDT